MTMKPIKIAPGLLLVLEDGEFYLVFTAPGNPIQSSKMILGWDGVEDYSTAVAWAKDYIDND
jgi:hypothetical protein